MNNTDVKALVLEFLKTDALLALGALLMALGVNLFSLGEYVYSVVFFVLSGCFFVIRTLRKTEIKLRDAGGTTNESIADTITDRLTDEQEV